MVHRTTARALTREESKAVTRKRLIDAALKLAGESGGSSLTASSIAREAGVAQPTFYVHFRDRDDLLRALGEVQIEGLRRNLARSRSEIDLDAPEGGAPDDDALRGAFRIAIEAAIGAPVLFRVYIRERTQTDTPLGRHCRRVADELRADLVDDLRALDEHLGRERTETRLEMLADGLTAYTEALSLGYLDGRYEDLDEALDALSSFARIVLA